MAEKPNRRGIAYWLRLAAFFVVTLVVGLQLAGAVGSAYRQVHPIRGEPCCLTPADFGFDYEDVRFPARDGIEIAGWYVPSQNGAAITLTHGIDSQRAMTLPVAAMLVEEGYGVLMFDLRAHGESEGDLFWINLAALDVLGAADYLAQQPDVDADRIGAWGFSAGGQASIHAAAQDDIVAAVASDGTGWTRFKDARGLYTRQTLQFIPYDFISLTTIELFHVRGTRPRALLDDVPLIAPRPLLLIVNGNSLAGNELLAAEQYQAVGGETVDYWVVPDTVHGGGWNKHPEDYRERLLTFFAVLLE